METQITLRMCKNCGTVYRAESYTHTLKPYQCPVCMSTEYRVISVTIEVIGDFDNGSLQEVQSKKNDP